MKKQIIFISLISGLLFSTSLKSQQINTDFTSALGGWAASGSAGLSLNATTGMSTLSNYNGSLYTTTDCRMIYTASMTFGGTSDRYILLKEQDIAGSANLMFQIRRTSDSKDFSVYGPTATGYSASKAISRYVIPGTNTVLCLGRIHQMFNSSTQFPFASNTAVSRMQYYHLPTSASSPANTYTIDFIKSYLDSATVYGSTEMDAAKYDIDFGSSTYTTGFSASPTTLTTDANNFILQSSASGTTDQAILTYEPSAPFLWTFSKQNVLVYKVNKQSITTNSHIKLRLTVPSTISPYSFTTFEYATPEYTSSNFDPNFKQVNIPGTSDYFLIFNLDGLTCGTAGAPSVSALKTQNACTATKLQLLLYNGLQASEVVKVDYVKPFATMSAAFTHVNGIVNAVNSGAPALKAASATTALTTTYGTASGSQTYYVSGCNLAANLVASAPTGFELNKDNGGTWASSVTFAQTSGIAGGTLKIRLKADASVGTYNSQNISLSSTVATSINITTPSSGNSVTAKALTAISSPLASNKVYDGTTATTISGTFTGLVGADDVHLTGNFVDANAGIGKSVTVSATLGGAQASNYTFTGTPPVGVVATISPASQSIIFGSLPTGKTVGDIDFAPGATSATSGTNTITYSSSDELVATIVSGQIHIVGAGECTIYANQASSTNYNAAAQQSQNITINARPTIALSGISTDADITTTKADVTVTGVLTVSNNSSVNSLTTDLGSQVVVDKPLTVATNLTVATGSKLNLTDLLTVNGDLILKSDQTSTSSVKIDHSMTINGTIKFLKTMDDTKWYFMAFPCDIALSGIKLNGNSFILGTDLFIKYYSGSNRATNGPNPLLNWIQITDDHLTANQGYIFGLPDGAGHNVSTITFPLDKTVLASEATQRDINVNYFGTLSNVENNLGWNLVGQPYLSKYASQTGANILNLYRYNGTTYDFYARNTLNLPEVNPFEAYFTQVTSGFEGSGLTFRLDARQSAPASVAVNQSDLVRLNISTATGTDKTYMIMDDLQSTNYQIGEDLEKMITTKTIIPQVYTVLGGINYANNALPVSSVNNLQLGFYTQTAGTTTISVDATNAPSISKLLLIDNSTNPATETDLLTSNYTFTAAAGTTNSRFTITAQRVTTEVNKFNSNDDAPQLSIVNNQLKIENVFGEANVRVFDAIGRMVTNRIVRNNSLQIKLSAKGMYTVQIEADGKSWVKKIVN
jgi:hypothetical protein